jgi:hypothetical protein
VDHVREPQRTIEAALPFLAGVELAGAEMPKHEFSRLRDAETRVVEFSSMLGAR